jgi:hypothetical protein
MSRSLAVRQIIISVFPLWGSAVNDKRSATLMDVLNGVLDCILDEPGVDPFGVETAQLECEPTVGRANTLKAC